MPHDTLTGSKSFKFKSILIDKTNNEGTINAKKVVPLKYICNFWRIAKIPLIVKLTLF